MPEFPIIDAHVHLWDPAYLRLPWLDGNPLLNRPYLLPEYAQATDGLAVEAMVYLETDVAPVYALIEAQWVARLAREEPRLRAIVAHAPLEFGERARAYLAALVAVSPLVKGVRRIYQGEPVAFSTNPDFVRGVQLLPEYDLTFDLCISQRHLANTIALVRQCPDTRIILDHIAKPDIAGRVQEPWMAQMRELASFPNVTCKISGVVTEADHRAWTPDDVAPYIRHALDVFGEDRIVFGGDWPVVLNAAPYGRWVETLHALTQDLSAAARRKLWAENARRFYRLDESGATTANAPPPGR